MTLRAIRSGLGIAVVGACMLSVSSTAHAASEWYSLIWLIDPVEPNSAERTVNPGDAIVEANLLPIGLLKIDDNAIAVDGNPTVSGGTHLVTLQARLRSACTFTYRPTGKLKQFFSGTDQRFTCLVDADKDGRFESAFTVQSSHIGIPLSQGKIPSKRTPIKPVTYRTVPIAEASGLPRLLYKYSHQDKITGHAYFGVCVGNSSTKKEICFDGYSGVRSDKLPKEIGAAGVSAIATAKDGQAVTVTVKHGFDQRPFSAMEY